MDIYISYGHLIPQNIDIHVDTWPQTGSSRGGGGGGGGSGYEKIVAPFKAKKFF